MEGRDAAAAVAASNLQVAVGCWKVGIAKIYSIKVTCTVRSVAFW